MNKHMITILSIIFASTCIHAQPRWELDLSLMGGFPTGEFDDVLDDQAIGGALRVSRWLGEGPFAIGLELGLLDFGDRTFGYPFQHPFDDETLKVTSSIATGHLTLRWQRQRGAFRPYLEGLVGVKRFETETEIFLDHYDEPLDSYSETDDTAFSIGCGIGASITLKNGGYGPGRAPTILLRGGCRYLHGDEAWYVPENSIDYDGAVLSYDLVKSETDLITADIGIAIKF